MPSPIRQLLSQTSYDADGTTTVWDFSFASGYLDKSHVKAFYLDSNGVRVPVPVTLGMFIGDYQLSITPALAVGNELTIYRDTPKDAPLVNFADKASFTEVALDLMATQAVFVAAEASDGLATAITSVAEIAAQVMLAADFAADSAASAVAAAASASSIGAAEANAAASAAAALASKLAAAASEAAAVASAVAADADAIATAADRVQTGLDKVATAADRVQTGLDRVATAADRVQTGLDRVAAASSASTASSQATAAAASAVAADASADAAAISEANAAASAASTNLPASLTGKALNFLRVKADVSGYEHRTAAEVKADVIPAASIVQADLATAVLPLGVAQTWQLVTRTSGVTYTNTTGRTIFGNRACLAGSASVQTTTISINGGTPFVIAAGDYSVTPNRVDVAGQYMVPDGATYVFSDGGAGTVTAYELR